MAPVDRGRPVYGWLSTANAAKRRVEDARAPPIASSRTRRKALRGPGQGSRSRSQGKTAADAVSDFDRQAQQRREEMKNSERRLQQKEENLDKKTQQVDSRIAEVEKRDRAHRRSRERRRGPRGRAQHAHRGTAPQARADLRPHRRTGQAGADPRDRERSEARSRATSSSASRPKPTSSATQRRDEDPRHGHPAHGVRLRRGEHGLGRRSAVRGHEGPHHRPRRPQHPRARAGHRRRPHRRRHAGSGHPLRLRSDPPRDRAHLARDA